MSGTGAALLWQGFQHRWGYNHRLNRLGSSTRTERVEGGEVQGHAVHTAASGTGPDRADFTTFWTELSAPGVGMYPGAAFFDLRGREGVAVEATQQVRLPVGGLFRDRRTLAAVLGGFDLCSLGPADKLVDWSASVGEPRYVDGGRFIELELRTRLKVNCTSGECPPLRQDFHYRLQLDWLLLAGDDELATSSGSFARRCEWSHDRRRSGWTMDTLKRPGLIVGGRPFLAATGPYQAGTPALRAISVSCVSDQHLAGLDIAIRSPFWTRGEGCTFELDLSFDQWRDGMQEARPPWSKLSFKSNGWAALSAEVVLIQLLRGRARNGQTRGALEWSAKGASADTIDAVASAPVTFKANLA